MGSETQRDTWGSKIDFILSCLGYAVGLGNVWRFPYLCGRSGGAAFLIPYLIMMIFAGLPTFYLELAIGQYAGLTPLKIYRRMCPVFTGIGWTMVTVSVITGIYYNMIIAWSLYYFGVSFTSVLPWNSCDPAWSNDYCFDDKINKTCAESGGTYFQRQCINFTATGNFSGKEYAEDFWSKARVAKLIESPATQYLKRRVLKDSGTLGDLGTPQWELVLCLFFAWVLVFFCLIKGIKSSGKVVYFTATFPYVVLFILMIRGVTLDGAYEGIEFYILKPNWTKLGEAKVWGDAATQIFFSLSLGWGGLTTLASYNQFHNNIFRDTLIVVLGNCATSIFAGFVIFPVIGFMAKNLHRPVAEIAAGGTTLAFQAYPDALTRLPGAPAWAILFFFMLVMLGIDTQMVILEVTVTSILDHFPSLRHWWKKMLVVGSVCICSFLIGLLVTCNGGSHLLDMLDLYAGGWTLVVACLVEVCMVSYAYGVRRFIKDIRLMLGPPPNAFQRILGYPVNPYWWVNWVFITPILLFVILVMNLYYFEPPKSLPKEYTWVGWVITFIVIAWIPLWALAITIYYICIKRKPLRWLITPSKKWGPNDQAAREQLANEHGMKPYAGAVPPQATNVIHPSSDPKYPQ